MKIGVITHHYVKNYGAFLQSRGLTETLKRLYPGAAVEIVDYVSIKHWLLNVAHVLHCRRGQDSVKTCMDKLRQLDMFNRYEHSLKRSPKVWSADAVKKLNYDLLVFGSDEIWDRKGRGFRPLKYGVGMEHGAGRMVAYAPSVGRVDGQEPLPEKLKEGLSNFDAVSARDIQTQNMVKQLGIHAPMVLDPTLLYSFDEELKRERVKKLPYSYILVYDCKLNQKQIHALTDYAKANGLEIIGGGDKKDYYTREWICLTPYQWVGLFQNASLVITGTFHGTVFSVKYRKNFVSYPTEPGRIQKISSLLELFGLSSRLLTEKGEKAFGNLISMAVDYRDTELRQRELYDASMDFLLNSSKEKRGKGI